MNGKEFGRYLERDGHKCLHCGTTDALVPNHRRNRGMGGSKARDVASNVVVLCSAVNYLIEADAGWAQRAVAYGWKVQGMDEPALVPVYDVTAQGWFVLDNNYRRQAVTSGDKLA